MNEKEAQKSSTNDKNKKVYWTIISRLEILVCT